MPGLQASHVVPCLARAAAHDDQQAPDREPEQQGEDPVCWCVVRANEQPEDHGHDDGQPGGEDDEQEEQVLLALVLLTFRQLLSMQRDSFVGVVVVFFKIH